MFNTFSYYTLTIKKMRNWDFLNSNKIKNMFDKIYRKHGILYRMKMNLIKWLFTKLNNL